MARGVEARAPQARHIPPPVTAQRVCEAAEQGDPLAQQAVARAARYLGLGLANLITLFTPDVIALGGGVMRSLHLFEPTIRETIRSMCGFVPHEKTRLVPAALGDNVGLVGAACAWWHRFEPARFVEPPSR
jgi:glucokinase